MRHSTLFLALPALLVLGCNTEQPSRGIQVSTSASITPPSSEPKIASSADLPREQRRSDMDMPAHSGAGRYYEVTQSGRTYVFSTAAARDRFVNGDSSVKLVTRVGADGNTFWVEADNADSLSASYDHTHPKP